MCGIAGVCALERGQTIEPGLVERMCQAIVHRGPDDSGTFVTGRVALGMRRLSIIDVEGGRQPITNEDGSLTIVFNGEIYNHLDVRAVLESKGHRFRTRSDTECVVHAYEEWGPACLAHLNGMFAIAIWDSRNEALFLARDRIGIKPLYLFHGGRRLSFASEIKALLEDRSMPRELDDDALSYFFKYGYVSPPATLLEAVRQLPPAHFLVADATGVRTERYWSVEFTSDDSGDEHAKARAVAEGLERAVIRQLISDVPLGAFLSGGLDSSSIVQVMSERPGSSVSTYSIGFSGADSFHSELGDARVMAERCGTNHHEILVRPDAADLIPRLVRHLDQPLADSSFVVTYLVSQLARETVKVILSGVGGDELFGGYRRYLAPSLDRYYDLVPAPVRGVLAAVAARAPVDRGSAVANYMRLGRAYTASHGLPAYERYDRSVRLLDDAALGALMPGLDGKADGSELEALRRSYFDGAPESDPLARMQALDLHTSLPDSLLLLTDKMSMATSLEARVPFLDHELVEAAARMPSSLKVHGTELRYVQKLSMRGRLPDEVIDRKKRGFGCPIGAWFRTDLRPMLHDVLAPSSLRQRGLFDPATVAQTIDAHDKRREDHSELLLSLLTFELWAGDVLDQ